MRVSGRLFFIIIIYCSASSCASMEHINRHFLSLFGFRLSERSAIRGRPFIYSPVIIIPTLNQKHNVNVQESNADSSYQANGDVFQKLTGDTNLTNTESVKISFSDSQQDGNRDDNIDPRQVLKLGANDNITDEAPSISNNTEPTTTMVTPSVANATEHVTKPQIETINNTQGPYPAPNYNNEFIKNLTLTTSAPLIQIKFALPEDNDAWKMFATNMKGNNKLHPYSYLHKELSEESPWSRRPSNDYYPGQFIPMASLYHDGYLHRPLFSKGFLPSRQLY